MCDIVIFDLRCNVVEKQSICLDSQNMLAFCLRGWLLEAFLGFSIELIGQRVYARLVTSPPATQSSVSAICNSAHTSSITQLRFLFWRIFGLVVLVGRLGLVGLVYWYRALGPFQIILDLVWEIFVALLRKHEMIFDRWENNKQRTLSPNTICFQGNLIWAASRAWTLNRLWIKTF